MNTPAVIVTRPQKQALGLLEGLAKIGRDALVFPMFEIEAIPDTTALDRTLARLLDFSLVVFVSPNAVDAAFARMQYLQVTWPTQVALGVMGVASKQALAQYGVREDQYTIFSPNDPERTDSETLFAALDLPALQGRRVLIIRGDSGRDFLAHALVAKGVEVEQQCAYRRRVPSFDASRKQQLLQLISVQNDWLITSSEVLKNLIAWCTQLDTEDAVAKMQQQHLFVPHFRIAEIAKELGFQSITLSASGDENLLLALQSQP